MKTSLAFIFLLIFTQSFAQNGDTEKYFGNPLEIPIILSGTFAELRTNHFHGGLDIKTEQREGLPVVAAADGYVSRISVSPWGYGKALYIQHPNGYTTVYGHLSSFSPEIDSFIRNLQYEQESYSVDVNPKENELPVLKGELIALSGNTGGSGGPHLHFEIRDAADRPMNPLMFGYEIPDSKAPKVSALFVYPLGEEAHVNQSGKRQKLPLTLQKDGSYLTPKIEACGDIGFGVSTVDQQDFAVNNNGVYRIETMLNGDEIFQANFEIFSFEESRRLNQLIDYAYYKEKWDKVQKLFVEKDNLLSIYSNVFNQGLVNVQDSMSYNYTIRITDFAGNERIIRIPIEGEMSEIPIVKEEDTTAYFVPAAEATLFEENGIDVYFPKNSLYSDTYLDLVFENEKVKVHEDVIPLHSHITIGFDMSKYKPEDREKMFVAKLSSSGKPYYSPTQREGDRFFTEVRNFGTFGLGRDVNAPKVVPVNFRNGQWISGNKDLKVKMWDDLSGIQSYKATVNGKFILMEYEPKESLFTHYFSDGVVTDQENKLVITVTDNVGNTTIFESTFFRKQ